MRTFQLRSPSKDAVSLTMSTSGLSAARPTALARCLGRHAPRACNRCERCGTVRVACVASTVTSQKSQTTSVSETGLPRTAVVGVLGGGQLGRMMALAAGNLGVKVKVLDPEPNAPASIAAEQFQGSFRDPAAIREFAKGVDVLTVEIEHIDTKAMESVAAEYNIDVEPTPATIATIQDKYAQKVHFSQHGVPVADFMDIPDEAALERAAAEYGFPLMLKSKRLAYDGRGNAVVRSASGFAAALAALGGVRQGLYAERWAPFVKELAVMVVRSRDGGVLSYPLVQTVHRDNICYVTEAPADVAPAVADAATQAAERAIACLDGAGIFGVEMFLLPDGRLLLNEVAPRPHNSGHYTQNGCVTSQFENHLRAVLGWPLGSPSLNCGCSLMLNLLGQADGEEGEAIAHATMARAYRVQGANVHWYGKPGMRAQRKVGHINIVAATREEARARLAQIDPEAAEALRSTDVPAPSTLPSLGTALPDTGAQVGIIMGSDSDLSTMRGAAEVLEALGVKVELTVVSAHRTPERMMAYARSAHTRGVKVIIAGAGGAAHLPGMVAAMTPLPVVGVPVRPAGAHLDGMDALLSIVQMPRGVPVATVAIGNAANAGLLAARILATSEPRLLQAMLQYQADMTDTVLDKAARLEQQGWRDYGKGGNNHV